MKTQTVPCELIDPDPRQPRTSIDQQQLKQLAASINDVGLLQPLIVFRNEDRLTVVDGHRRLAALRQLKQRQAAAYVLNERPDENRLLLTQLIANGQRADLSPLDTALAYKRLRDAKCCTNTELAAELHVSKSRVTMYLSLLRLPEDARALVNDGSLAVSSAYAIARVADNAARAKLLHDAVTGDAKRDDIARRASGRPAGKLTRVTFPVGNAEITIGTRREVDLSACVTLLEQLLRHCRKASKEQLSLPTVTSLLADGQRNSPAANADRQTTCEGQSL